MKISYLRSGRLAGVCALLSALAVGSDLAGQTSIWPASAVPTLIDGGTDAPVELGVKFRSDVAGTISGIRFYKALANTGTHVGKLWSSTGTLLASTTFTNETASGWQQMNFPSPVAISAGTVYIASYRCANGHYSADVNYFSTSGVDNPPLHALATGVAGGNGVFTYGSGNTFPNQTWFAANYWVDVVFSATNSPTLTSIAVTPAGATIAIDATRQFTATGTYSNGGTQNLTTQVTWASSSTGLATISSGGLATGVGAGTTTISASLSGVSGSATLVVQPASLSITTQLLAAATLNTSYSTTLASSGGTPPLTWSIASGSLPVGLMLNAGSGAITGIPTATGTFAFTVRVADSGNPQQAVTKAFNLTVSTAPTTRSIWPATTVPSLIDSGADNPVELGVKFRSDQAGTISGVRFYKAGANTGTHVGKLWSATGTLLASATFTGETASGWQQVNFSAPVSIAANTTYVASYHCASGHYSADANYFTSSFDSPPLHAPSSATTGGNGVYAYGSGSFPNSTWNAANYWVDVVFSSSTQTDTTRPTINTVSPGDGATNVSLGSSISTIFSEPMDPATITGSTITLRNSLNTSVPATVSYNAANRTATLTPTNALTASTAYTATVLGGQSGVADLAGNRLLASQSWTFTTAASNPWGDGPGGPILVVTSTGNPFTEYYAEILLAEGLNAFTLQNISSVTSDTLAGYDLVILGEQTLTDAQVTMFTTWVNAGGNLIALRPDKKLAVLLGLTDAGSTLMEGYLLVNTASAPGAGIVGETIQFHGAADRYVLSGATTVATLYSSPAAATANPAVSLRSIGSNGGQAAAFTFDLARSIVQTRQGNPAWAGQERDGMPPSRPNDLFYGNASFDPQPDWVNLNKAAIPQADEQQRLLANLITAMVADRKPLPRFWYFPNGMDAVVVMTGDDHGNNGTTGRFNNYLAFSPPGGSTQDWETIRATSYVYPSTPISNAQATAFNAAGFEIGLHLNTDCDGYDRASLRAMFAYQLAAWRSNYPSLPDSPSQRVHCIAWSGYTILPEVEWEFGIRMDTTYYYWPPSWVGNRPGFMTGSGMPMRFATATGNVIDVYQAATQMTDESGQSYPFTIDTLLDRALGPEGFYGAFVANHHTDVATTPESDATILSAVSRGVPVISARQLLTWIDGRNRSALQSITRNGSVLSFSVEANTAARGLQVMVPVELGARVSSVMFNGVNAVHHLKVVKGVAYVVIPALSGSYEVVFTADTTAPTVVDVSPSNGATDILPTHEIQIAFSEPMNASTVNASTVILRDQSNRVVPTVVSYQPATFSAIVRPTVEMVPAQTYTISVPGSTGATDVSNIPLAVSFSSSFTTIAVPTQPVSIWSASDGPSVVTDPDTASSEVGVKFQSAAPGYITAIRFYKGPANTGSHVGRLWTANGMLLASVTFVNETASGWQQQALSSPSPISANTTYVVSYHANAGQYSTSPLYFSLSGHENWPLRALADGESGGNGVFAHSASGIFPTLTYRSENYWVDVVFQASSGVASTEAAPGRSDVAVPPAVPAPDLSYRSTLSRRPLPISSRVLASVAERVTTGKVCGGCLNPPIGTVSHSNEDPAVHVAQRSELNAEAWRLYTLSRKDRGALALDVARVGTPSF